MSDSDSDNEKISMKAPIFNNDLAIFSKMFSNYGACQGFGSVIDLKTDDPNLPSSQSDLSNEPSLKKKTKAAVRKNFPQGPVPSPASPQY